MVCSNCGKPYDPQALFCSHCGKALAAPSSFSSFPQPAVKTTAFKIGCIVAIFFFFILLGVSGLLGVIFYEIKNSTANQIAVEALKKNPIARDALGDIQKIGWPIGNISVKGSGSGDASFSMSVKGSKAKGKYYATLRKINGLWILTASRLQIEGGPSLELGGGPLSSPPFLPSP